MRTNIDIDDGLMAAAMDAGGFKTKREAVEEGLRLVGRRKVYEGLLALRGKLQWDDSDAAWALARAEKAPDRTVQEPQSAYGARGQTLTAKRTTKTQKTVVAKRSKAK